MLKKMTIKFAALTALGLCLATGAHAALSKDTSVDQSVQMPKVTTIPPQPVNVAGLVFGLPAASYPLCSESHNVVCRANDGFLGQYMFAVPAPMLLDGASAEDRPVVAFVKTSHGEIAAAEFMVSAKQVSLVNLPVDVLRKNNVIALAPTSDLSLYRVVVSSTDAWAATMGDLVRQ